MKTILLVLAFTFFSAQLYAGECSASIMPQLSDGQTKSSKVAEYLTTLSGTVLFSGKEIDGSYCQLHHWYEKQMSSRRFSSRMLAVLVIVLGASLPLIGILEKTFINQKFWVAFIGAAIVVAQGFAQTFQYEESWRNFTVAKLELESTHRTWQRKVVDANLEPDGLKMAQLATIEFEAAVAKIVAKETTGFFDSLRQAGSNGKIPSGEQTDRTNEDEN